MILYLFHLGIRFWLLLSHICMILRVSWPLLVPLVEYLYQEVDSPFLLHYLHPQVVYNHISLVFGPASLAFNSLSHFYLPCIFPNQIQSWYRNWLRSIKLLIALLGLPLYPQHHPSLLGGISNLMRSSVLARPLQVKELFTAFVFINLPHAYLIFHFSTGLTSSPSRHTNKLKMV